MPGLEGSGEEARGNGSHPVSTVQWLLTAFAHSNYKERGLSRKQNPNSTVPVLSRTQPPNPTPVLSFLTAGGLGSTPSGVHP